MNRTSKLHLLRALLVVAPMLVLTSCGGSDSPGPTGPGPAPDPNPNPAPSTGSIQVSTTTTGADLDPDGYMADMDGNGGRSIGLNGVTTFTAVATGQHAVELTGLADNCSVMGTNPAITSVTANATAQVGFEVTCVATTGSIELTITTANNFDHDGYQVNVGGTVVGRVNVNDSALFEGVPAGNQQIELTDIAPNCLVDGTHPATVTVPAGGSVAVSFTITCTSPPNGRIIFLVAFQNVGVWFHIMNADGSGQFQFRKASGRTRTPVWSPDGNRIAYSDTLGIYVMNKDATGLIDLTSSPNDVFPAWSPDGSKIAFNRDRGYRTDSEIFLINSDGSGIEQQLTNDPELASYTPSWSPDGTRIVLSQNDDPGDMNADRRISVMNADGSNVTRITEPAPICDQGFNAGFPAWMDWAPDWSPDGSRIVFMRRHVCEPQDTTNDTDIMVMNPDGTDLVNLTDGPAGEGLPRWSPDGNRLVYESSGAIWVMNADGTDQAQLPQFNSNSYAFQPAWGP